MVSQSLCQYLWKTYLLVCIPDSSKYINQRFVKVLWVLIRHVRLILCIPIPTIISSSVPSYPYLRRVVVNSCIVRKPSLSLSDSWKNATRRLKILSLLKKIRSKSRRLGLLTKRFHLNTDLARTMECRWRWCNCCSREVKSVLEIRIIYLHKTLTTRVLPKTMDAIFIGKCFSWQVTVKTTMSGISSTHYHRTKHRINLAKPAMLEFYHHPEAVSR